MINKFIDYINNHWYIATFVNSIAAIWFTVVKLFGKQFLLIDKNGNLYPSIAVATGIIIVVSILINFLLAISSSKKRKLSTNGQEILQEVISSQISLSLYRIKLLNKVMKNGYKGISTFFNITTPFIDETIKELNLCINKNIDNLPRESIGISIITKYDFQNKWKYESKLYLDTPMNIEKVVTLENSTAKQIIDGKTDCIFMNKETALKENKYIISNKDKQYKNKGTIICKKIDVECDGKNLVEAILNITTYDCELCKENDIKAKKRILEFIIKPFEKNIQHSLCLTYIRELAKEQKKQFKNLKNTKTS